MVRNSCVCNSLLLISPVINCLGISCPLFLSSNKWLRRWVSWSSWYFTFCSKPKFIWSWSTLELSGRLIWYSGIGDFHLILSPITNCLGICGPLFLTSYKWLRRWVSWTTKLFTIFCNTEWSWTFGLSCRVIWKSSICFINLIILIVTNILSIIHPLLFTSNKWLR